MPVLLEARSPEQGAIQPLQRVHFKIASTCFQIKRAIDDLLKSQKPLSKGNRDNFPFLWAESRSPLFSEKLQERPLEEAKQENLRLALDGLEGVVVPNGSVFSFWRQVGRPTTSRGYRIGREIRWGCTIPTVGGGLCQLSGALFECALQAGARIVEVHPHTRRLPGIAYRADRDATIFWNYVDFQFQPQAELLIEPVLTPEELILRFWGKTEKTSKPSSDLHSHWGGGSDREVTHDCLVCGLEDCAFHGQTQILTSQKELIFYPGLGEASGIQKLKTRSLSLAGRFFSRLFNGLGYPVGKAAILRARSLAFLVKVLYPFFRDTPLVSQDVAPFLHRWFQSRGISYVLKLEHLPIKTLQSRLDQLARLHPEDVRLREFRAEGSVLDLEQACIEQARELWTDHPYLKELFPRAKHLETFRNPPRSLPAGGPKDRILFPGPCYGREGLIELLEAAKELNLKIICPHPTAQDHPSIQYIQRSQLPWESLVAYAHPCVFDRPGWLLNQAIANEIPVVGTEGVPYRGHLFKKCALGNQDDLGRKLREVYIRENGGGHV